MPSVVMPATKPNMQPLSAQARGVLRAMTVESLQGRAVGSCKVAAAELAAVVAVTCFDLWLLRSFMLRGFRGCRDFRRHAA